MTTLAVKSGNTLNNNVTPGQFYKISKAEAIKTLTQFNTCLRLVTEPQSKLEVTKVD